MKNPVRNLFFLTTLVLFIFAAGSIARAAQNQIYLVYAVLMLADAVVMLVCGLYIDRKHKVIFWFAVSALALNIFLTIFDQVGLVDILFALLNLMTLVILFMSRKEILPQ
jgi:hypothetical protein